MTAMTEWIWVFLVFWIFVTVFGFVKRDAIVRMIAGLLGMIFGIVYLSTSFIVALSMVFLNFYLLYDAISE